MQEYQLIRTCLLQALELRAHMQGSTFCASYEHLTPFFFLSFYFPELCCRFLITMPSSFILLTFVSVSLSVRVYMIIMEFYGSHVYNQG